MNDAGRNSHATYNHMFCSCLHPSLKYMYNAHASEYLLDLGNGNITLHNVHMDFATGNSIISHSGETSKILWYSAFTLDRISSCNYCWGKRCLEDPWIRLFSQISNCVRRECELLALPHQELAGEQPPDTTIEMELYSFGQIRRKQNAMNHEILAWSCQLVACLGPLGLPDL